MWMSLRSKMIFRSLFKKGFEKKFGPTKDVILPEKDIDESLNADNAYAYKAVVDGNFVGGAVVGINEMTQENTLDLLYVKHAEQGRGIGKKNMACFRRVISVYKNMDDMHSIF